MTFRDLGLSDEVCRAVDEAGYQTATPIQQKSIPHILMGKDILGTAQTGTGKTAAFLLPMIDVMAQGVSKPRMPRALVLEPTRELAAQVAESFDIYAEYQKLSRALVIGGLGAKEQEADLDGICDIIIATPGRLLDMFDRGRMMLSSVQFLVIDEADRMMDMGFIPDVEKIVSLLPRSRQTLFFSATMPKPIRKLADKFLTDPKEAEVAPPASPAETVEQRLLRVSGDASAKRAALRKLIDAEKVRNALIFCNRKSDVKVLHKSMQSHGYDAVALHGDMDQVDRMATLEKFKTDQAKYMVCSDVAARGLDIQGLSHVFNFDVPFNADDYVHRIGRTGRAGMRGKAFTLVTSREDKQLAAIHALIRKDIPLVDGLGVDKDSGDKSDETKAGEGEAPPTKPKRTRRRKSEDSGDQDGDGSDHADETKAGEGEASPAKPKRTRRRKTEDGGDQGGDRKAEKAQQKPQDKPESRPEPQAEPDSQPRLPNGDGDSRPAPEANRKGTSGANTKGKGRQSDKDTPKGLGDHVPAFLQKPLRQGRAG